MTHPGFSQKLCQATWRADLFAWREGYLRVRPCCRRTEVQQKARHPRAQLWAGAQGSNRTQRQLYMPCLMMTSHRVGNRRLDTAILHCLDPETASSDPQSVKKREYKNEHKKGALQETTTRVSNENWHPSGGPYLEKTWEMEKENCRAALRTVYVSHSQ